MTENVGKRIAVLMGGWSAEREVSLVSGAAVVRALRERGFDATAVDAGHRVGQTLAALKPDVVFNALHGRFGEDGCVQGMLEVMGLNYTHSGVLASALAMDKPTARVLFQAAGIRVPQGRTATREEVMAGTVMAPPYVVKPTNEGSSVGVRIVFDRADNPFAAGEWHYGDTVLVERYVKGRELAVAVMGEEALGVIEIKPAKGFYDYEAKYAAGGSAHVTPADLPTSVYQEAMDIAARAHRVLGCRGVSRADLRYDDSEDPEAGMYLLEINTQPGMTPTSLVPEIAAYRGIPFGDLVNWMVEDAGCRR